MKASTPSLMTKANCAARPMCLHMSAATPSCWQSYAPTARHCHSASIPKIGRASCRERVCQYVYFSLFAVSLYYSFFFFFSLFFFLFFFFLFFFFSFFFFI